MSDYIKPESLRNLIISLIGNSNIHIGIHDISGILNSEPFAMEYYYRHHGKPICTAAKGGPDGYLPCTGCKKRAYNKALELKKPFFGHCEFGLFEVVKPVIIAKKVLCVIYVGNMVLDKEKTLSKMKAACDRHKVPYENVAAHLDECESITSPDRYITIANVVDSYIQMLYKFTRESSHEIPQSEYHWAVSTMIEYINAHYMDNITLEGIAELFYMNSKYMGRLFKSQTGSTFHEHLNNTRINKAVDMLVETDKNILEIALLAGFQNVTYFNRVFNKKFGTTPTKYRSDNKNEE